MKIAENNIEVFPMEEMVLFHLNRTVYQVTFTQLDLYNFVGEDAKELEMTELNYLDNFDYDQIVEMIVETFGEVEFSKLLTNEIEE